MKTYVAFNDGSTFTTKTTGICLEKKIESWAKNRKTSLTYRESWKEEEENDKKTQETAKKGELCSTK